MAIPRFHDLTVSRINPEAAGAVAVTLAIPPALRETFAFDPGQFLTLRADVNGESVRRSYSICCPRSRLAQAHEVQVGIRPMDGGVFSNWAATQLKAGDTISVMPPDGRFGVRRPHALHRVGFAVGSGITPILSIMASTLEEHPESRFTLVYGNRRMASVMFNETLQDLKDRYTGRLTLIHILSRQAQEVDLLQGHIDADKVRAIVKALLPVGSMDEVFICGPEAMIDTTEATLLEAGVPQRQIHTERFTSPTLAALSPVERRAAVAAGQQKTEGGNITLTVVLDGKPNELRMGPDDHVLDAGLAAGLDLPYSCKAGVCCTCRAKVLEGEVRMDKNFTLEPWEMDKGFVLTCQARSLTDKLVVSYDER